MLSLSITSGDDEASVLSYYRYGNTQVDRSTCDPKWKSTNKFALNECRKQGTKKSYMLTAAGHGAWEAPRAQRISQQTRSASPALAAAMSQSVLPHKRGNVCSCFLFCAHFVLFVSLFSVTVSRLDSHLSRHRCVRHFLPMLPPICARGMYERGNTLPSPLISSGGGGLSSDARCSFQPPLQATSSECGHWSLRQRLREAAPPCMCALLRRLQLGLSRARRTCVCR